MLIVKVKRYSIHEQVTSELRGVTAVSDHTCHLTQVQPGTPVLD